MPVLAGSVRIDTTKHSSSCAFSSSKPAASPAAHLSHGCVAGSLKFFVKDWEMGVCCSLQCKEDLNLLLPVFKRLCYSLWHRCDEWGKKAGDKENQVYRKAGSRSLYLPVEIVELQKAKMSLESKISSSYPREVGTLSSGLHPGAALVHFSISHGIKLEEGRTKPSRTGLRVSSGKINPKTKTRWLGLVILDGITLQLLCTKDIKLYDQGPCWLTDRLSGVP